MFWAFQTTKDVLIWRRICMEALRFKEILYLFFPSNRHLYMKMIGSVINFKSMTKFLQDINMIIYYY